MFPNLISSLALALAIGLTGCAAGPSPTASVPSHPPAPPPTPSPTPTPPTVATLAVCGDVMSHMPVTRDAWDEAQGRYDYTPIFEQASPYVERLRNFVRPRPRPDHL